MINNDINSIDNIMEYFNMLYNKGLISNLETLKRVAKKIRLLSGFEDDTDDYSVCALFKEICDIVKELDYADLFVLWNTNRLYIVYEHNTSRDTTFDNEIFLNYLDYCPIYMVYTHRKTKQLFVSRFKRPNVTPNSGSRITWGDFDIHTAYIRRTTKSIKTKGERK
jgi:hypothetical protein